MTSWLILLFWVLAHSVWQAALVWLLYRAPRFLRPCLPSWSGSAIASLALFSVPALSVATAMALVSQALATSPSAEDRLATSILLLPAVWGVVAAFLGTRLLVAMRRSLSSQDGNGMPRVIGWLRPSIVVPDAVARRLSDEQLMGVIAHEQEHIRTGDAWINLIQCWLDALYFFNPAYRWLSHAAREQREFRCDDAAASKVGTIVYLRALVEAAKLVVAPSPCELTVAGDLERRVARLADKPTSKGGRLELGAALAMTVVLVVSLPRAVTVPASHLHAASWQARMVPVGNAVRGVVVPPLRTVGHALRKVTP